MLKIFRVLSLLEGCSYLLILSTTLGYLSRDFVYVIGMSHGILFLLYFVLSLLVSHIQKWSVLVWLMVLLAAIVPLAFIPVEFFLKKELKKTGNNI